MAPVVYLHQDRACAAMLFVCVFVCLSVCLSFCEENYCNSNELTSLQLGVMTRPTNQIRRTDELTSLKLGVMTRPTNQIRRTWCHDSAYQPDQQNWLTCGGDPILDTDSRSLFLFSHYCKVGDFRRFISISHTVTGWFLQHWRNDWWWQEHETTTFWERSNPD